MSKSMCHSFDVEDAVEHGPDSAVLLYNIRYWLIKNKANNRHNKDGYYWTFNSSNAYHLLFPYINPRTIRKHLLALEEKGALKSCSGYNKAKMDRTKWYTIPAEFAVIKDDPPIGTSCHSIGKSCQTIPDVNTDINNKAPTPPLGAGGFLRPEEIASEKKSTRKPRQERTRKQEPKQVVGEPVMPDKIKYAYWEKGKDEWRAKYRTEENPTIENMAELIVERYKRLQPVDPKTRGRGKRHIIKLLTSGAYTFNQLYLAMERYHAMSQPYWARNAQFISYQNEDAHIESPYVKGIGNFFGKDKIYQHYLGKPGKPYKADIEEEDWEYFRLWRNHANSLSDHAWGQNVTFNRLVALFGYTPEQLGGDYDRRFEVC